MTRLTEHALLRAMGERNICAYSPDDRIKRNVSITSQAGFSLIEIIAVLVIVSVLAAIAVPRYIDLDAHARLRAIDAGVAELNGREGLAWSNIKISPTGYQDDATMFGAYDKNLGADYFWTVGPNTSGGTLKFGLNGEEVVLIRSQSTDLRPGHWSK